MTKLDAFIVDIDGTLALHEGVRSPYDESCVLLDNPNLPVIGMVRILHTAGYKILITSGRHDTCRQDTVQWLVKHAVPFDALYMRPARSSKHEDKDADVKERIYREYIEPSYNVLGVYDDRMRVVDRWRQLGLTCYQVAPGNF